MIKLSQPIFSEEEIEAVAEVLRSGMLIQGEKVKAFEDNLATYTGAKYVVAVTSATAALHLALVSLGIGPGDAVFVPAFTFPATANVVEIVGARPIFIDVDPETYCITPLGLRQAIKNWAGPEKPKAVIPVHEFGAPCDMEDLMIIAKEEGLYIVEDAACALGTRYKDRHVGTFRELGCFSFHPRKAITTGEGGAITTNDYNLYTLLLKLRNHGMEKTDDGRLDFYLPGYNYRMTEFQAALGLIQLNRFNEILKIRNEISEEYYKGLSDIHGTRLPKSINGHAWQTFMVILPKNIDRNSLISELKSKGIETNLGAQALHMLKYYKEKYDYSKQEYLVAAELFEQGLAIPLHSHMKKTDWLNVVDELKVSLLSKKYRIVK
jgi:perosamine synthetase